MHGLHLTADLHQCRCEPQWLIDAALLGQRCAQAVGAAGLQAVAQLFHAFPGTGQGPGGVTATVLLAESHLCVHTWPEQRAVTLDVYVCNFGGDHSAKAHALMAALTALFDAGHVERHSLMRGNAAAPLDSVAVKLDQTFGRLQDRGDVGRAGLDRDAGESD
jgi:S-adenosylmethionine decarboxylase